MIKAILELITQPSVVQADIVISVIGFLGAFVVAVFGFLGSALTFYFNRRSERNAERRKIKEGQYLEFLANLAAFKIAEPENNWEIRNTLSALAQTLYLVGSTGVQQALKTFLDYLLYEDMDIEKQKILYD